MLLISAQAQIITAGTSSIKLPEADLRQEWLQIDSVHFRITYPAHLKQLSIVIAEEAEYVYEILSSWTGYYPRKKIDILLIGSSDVANGFAKYGPSGIFISLYAVYPYATFNMSIDEYENWYRHLIIHELSHYFHLNKVEGLPEIARHILGNVIYPNSTTPLFVREGFAAYSETRNDSGFGRGNSPYTDMYINASVLDNDFTTLDEAANRSPVWPGSGSHYLFGVSFFNYLALQYGEEKILHFNEMSAHYTPFCWSIAFRRDFKKSMREMWDEWEEYEKARRLSLLNRVAGEKMTVFDPIGKRVGTVYSLSFDPSGKRLAYSMSTPNDTGGIYIYDLNERKQKRLKTKRAAYDISFSKDGRKLYYIRVERERNLNLRKNIYSLDIRTRKEKEITKSGSVQGFALLPEQDAFLVCMSAPNGTIIRLIDTKGNVLNTPVSTEDLRPVILEEPSVSPNGKRVAFSGREENGNRTVFIADVRKLHDGSLTLSSIQVPVHSAYSPQWINNREILFVGSDDGCFNLYTADIESGSVARITNVPTGVFIPDISIDELIAVSEYTSRGFRPAYIKMEALSDFTERQAKSIARSTMEPQSMDPDDGAAHTSSPAAASSPVRYRSYKYLAPGYWLPVWSSDTIYLGFGVHTHGNDLLNKHRYDMSLVYDIIDSRFKYEVGYTLNTDSLTFSTNMFLSQKPYADSFSPSFALKQAVWYNIVKSTYMFQGGIGAVLENPFFGPDLGVYFSNIKKPPQWAGPKSGVAFSQDIFLNSRSEQFAVVSSTLSGYAAVAEFLLMNLTIENKTGIGSFNEHILSGNTSAYAYAPLNGVLTRGYPQSVYGSSVTDCKLTVTAPMLTVYRGVYAFPIFLKNIHINIYSDNGIILAPSSPYSFVATNLEELAASPLQYIRSSAGVELVISTILGYEFPFDFAAGYVYPFSSLGKSGIYLEAGLGSSF